MKTVSIGIQNLCAACGCACRYCLLSSRKKAEGVDYYRGKRIAERFVAWANDNRIFPLPFYYVSFCAEFPQLYDNIAFNRAIRFPGARFLQCNGIAIRSQEETDLFVSRLIDAGVESIDTTFFGTRSFHDSFAARKGDFDFMYLLASRASAHGLTCTPTVVITKSNLRMMPELFSLLEAIPNIGTIHSFLPDHRGRGYLLEPDRISLDEYHELPDGIRRTINMSRYKTEADWLNGGLLPEYTKRDVTITLRADNIDFLEPMSCDEMLAYVEQLDEAYYQAIPSINELAQMYGDRTNRKLYQLRDLFWIWQKRYIRETGIELYDVTDERNCNTVRSF